MRLLAGILALLIAAPVAQAAFPGDNGRIVFSSDRDGNAEVYSMAADGSDVRRLTNDASSDSTPAFAPASAAIAFASTRPGFNDIFRMDPDGTALANLSNLGGDDLNPSFSPDGKRIVWSRNNGGNFDIFTMDAADGANQVDIDNDASGDLDPTWGPGGQRIAFTRNLGGNFEVFSMKADGTDQVNLTASAGVDADASYSPDGTRIAFRSNRAGNDEIYVMDADGANPTRLTNDPGSDVTPAFSPDGKKIAFTSDRNGNQEVYVMDADGSTPIDLSGNAGADSAPDWGAKPAPTPTPTPVATATAAVTATTAPTATSAPASTAAPPSSSGGSGSSGGGGGGGGSSGTGAAALPAAPTVPPSPIRAAVTGSGILGSVLNTVARKGTPAARNAAKRTAPANTTGPAVPGAAAAGTAPTPIPEERVTNPRRSRVASLLLRPDRLFVSWSDLGRSFLIAALLVGLLGFPATLFNATSKSNREHMAAALARLRRRLGIERGSRGPLRIAAVSVVAAALIGWFVDPGFPTSPGSPAYALGVLIGAAALVAISIVVWRIYLRRYLPRSEGTWMVYPGQILVSAACVAVSRFAHFVPGLLLGTPGEFEPDREIAAEHAGRRVAFNAGAIAAVSLTAWVASIPVDRACAEPGAATALLVLDAALAVIAVSGMETLVFSLAPFRFLDGYDLFRWRPRLWFALWALGAVWFALVIVNPALSHYQASGRASLGWLVGLLLFEATVAVGLWAFFLQRDRRRGAVPV